MPYVRRPHWPCEGKGGSKEADLKSALSHTEMAARMGRGECQTQPRWGLGGGERHHRLGWAWPGQASCGGWTAPLWKGAGGPLWPVGLRGR